MNETEAIEILSEAILNDELLMVDQNLLVEATEKAISALERQIPKLAYMCHCNCGMAIDNGWDYCPKCGQRLEGAK